jgi:hypothetical protein
VLHQESVDFPWILSGEIHITPALGFDSQPEGKGQAEYRKIGVAAALRLHRILPLAVIRSQCPPRSS